MKKLFKKSLCVLLILSMLPLGLTTYANTNEEAYSSSDVPQLHINADDGVSFDDTIYKSKDEKVRATASVSGAENAAYNFSELGIEIKTRGNSTWGGPKWPYQIKFDSKIDLFGMGKAKKWILLANYFDGTFVRNKIVFDLGEALGMPYICQSVFVELYVNGSYQGLYQLCEKVELGSTRVDLKTDYGVLLEMDGINRNIADEIYFVTATTEKPFVYKEYNTDFEDEAEAEKVAEIREFTESYINEFETELYSENASYEKLASMIDVDSFINYYFITELTNEIDATFASTYFYIDGPGDVLHCGPLWDYDRIFGWSTNYIGACDTESDFLKNIRDNTETSRIEWFKELFRHPEFVELVNKKYDDIVKKVFDAEKICASIDEYQSYLMPALKHNHEKYVVFHSISTIGTDLFDGTSEEHIIYSTNEMKKWITARCAYLEKAYGYDVPTLTYQTYEQSFAESLIEKKSYTGGAMTVLTDGILGINGLTFNLGSSVLSGSIEYCGISRGTESEYKKDGELITANSPFSGIKLRLTDDFAEYYDIEYRVYSGNAWSEFAKNGELAGKSSGANYIKRIQARIVKKDTLTYSRGDIDANGSVNLRDSFAMKLYISFADTPTALERLSSDLDRNYSVNARDSFELAYRIAMGSFRD